MTSFIKSHPMYIVRFSTIVILLIVLSVQNLTAGSIFKVSDQQNRNGIQERIIETNHGVHSPNVVIILPDEMRYDTHEFNGNDYIETPNLDKLAENGIVFRRAYANNSVCTPSRTSILTGLYPQSHGVLTNGQTIGDNINTLAHYLSEYGYETASFGKLHLYPMKASEPEPDFGFDHIYSVSKRSVGDDSYWDFMLNYHPEHLHHPEIETPDLPFESGGDTLVVTDVLTSSLPIDLYPDTWTTDKFVDFIKNRKSKNPFFSFIGYRKPHFVFNVPAPFDSMYYQRDVLSPIRSLQQKGASPANKRGDDLNENQLQNMIRAYYGLVSYVDSQIGRVVQSLKDSGEFEDTIIIYISDHGDMLGDHGLVLKHINTQYEGIVHIPLFIHWPQKLDAYIVNNIVESIDIVPTLLGMLNIKIDKELDGDDLSQSLLKKEEVPHDKMALTQQPEVFSLVGKNYKLVVRENGKNELYDGLDKRDGEYINHWDDPAYTDIKEHLLLEMLRKQIEISFSNSRDKIAPY